MHEKRIEIRWRDMDAFGHVNNSVYLTFLEEARDEWLEKALDSPVDTWEFVVARVAIDFRSPLRQSEGWVLARCRLDSVGTSSFTTHEELIAADGRVAAEAATVMVAIHRGSETSRPLSEGERSALERA
ncbi:MAG: acyl-CoA thioesterase [Actinomycetota bacterium]